MWHFLVVQECEFCVYCSCHDLSLECCRWIVYSTKCTVSLLEVISSKTFLQKCTNAAVSAIIYLTTAAPICPRQKWSFIHFDSECYIFLLQTSIAYSLWLHEPGSSVSGRWSIPYCFSSLSVASSSLKCWRRAVIIFWKRPVSSSSLFEDIFKFP